MENDMKQDYFYKKCKCGEELKVPREYPGKDVIRLYQITCTKGCKTHTFDYVFMRWWR